MKNRVRRILHIEPNPMDAELTTTHFAATAPHLQAQVVASCVEALPLLSLGHDFDLVLANLRAPGGMEAGELIREAAHRGIEIPFVIVAPTADEATAVSILGFGASDYIVKRDNYLVQLPHVIDHALQRAQLQREIGERRRTEEALRASEARYRTDITERRRGEELLRATEARFRSLFEHSPNCLWEEDGSEFKQRIDELRASGVTDMRAHFQNHPEEVALCLSKVKVLDVNQAALQLYEARDKAELISGLGRVLTPESFVVLTQELIALAEGQTVFESEATDQTFTGKKNHILLKALVAPGCEATLSRVYVSIVDITARKLLEDQLRQSQKMEAVGHLAGGVAHDFNNLLTVIHGNTALLQMKELAAAEQASALEEIAQATERAAALTRQLLTFSRQQALQPRQLDLNEVVAGLAKMLHRVVGEDVRLQLSLHPHRLVTHGDAGMLDQVLLNLVVNARDAMPDGGQLIIETAEARITDDNLHQFVDAQPGLYVSLRVTDTGCGIAPENLAHIFEPFFTTKGPGKGTGLGLATVFGIVKQHRGVLAVTSDLNRGTTFSILLPTTDDAVVSPEKGGAEPLGGTEAILLVEDEESVRRLVHRLLEMHGYRVQIVNSGAEALRLWEQKHDRFDLMITDVVMPGGISGPALAERLCADQPDLKVIYMSGYAGDVAGRGVKFREGVNFLQKPFGRAPLLACVRACLDATQASV